MDKTIEVLGYWKLVGGETKIKGILSFDPVEGVSLKLEDFFEKSVEDLLERVDFIHGEAISGELYTLYECRFISQGYSNDRGRYSEIFASMLFVGHHFKDVSELEFDRVWVRFSQLSLSRFLCFGH